MYNCLKGLIKNKSSTDYKKYIIKYLKFVESNCGPFIQKQKKPWLKIFILGMFK